MFMTIKRWQGMIDAETGQDVWKGPGRYEVEVIPCPYPGHNCPWIVLKGTKIGGSKEFWEQFADSKFGDNQVIIEE